MPGGQVDAEKELLLACTSEVIGMSSQQKILGKVGTMAATRGQAELDVTASVEIGAESRRVFYALTLPEYIEAWLQIPAAEKLQCSANSKAPNSFRIDVYSAEVLSANIEVSCLLLNSDRVIYLWKNTRVGNKAETVVDVRIKSSLGRCVINLSHSGFDDTEESLWHLRMWRSSLNKLCGLMTALSGTTHPGGASHNGNSSEIHPAPYVVWPSAYRRT
jgi:hypothetical protein